MKRTVTFYKTQISLGINIVGNIYDNVSTQINKIVKRKKSLVVVKCFNVEMLHVTVYLY